MESGAYGAAKAGGSFDLRRFLAQPQVVARAVSLVFALIVFSCIFGEGYSNTHESHQRYCVFNRNEDACRYGSAIGVLAFLACAFFFVVDVYFPQISNAVDRKYLVIGDLLFSALWTFLWFVGFCFLTNQWAATNPKDVLLGADSARAAITFSFFSIFSWPPCRACWPPWPTSATRPGWTTLCRTTRTPPPTPAQPTPPTRARRWTATSSLRSLRTRRPPRVTSLPLCTEPPQGMVTGPGGCLEGHPGSWTPLARKACLQGLPAPLVPLGLWEPRQSWTAPASRARVPRPQAAPTSSGHF
uniref:Synaptogyrin 2 n=1 Tax=Myotis myotis TaxID=51298 RepID=A0A7J7T8T0_MYOMY|nr:synaptogyrin 2 [Myotis myotis]